MVNLRCDMRHDCAAAVTHIDESGFAYCAPHGEQRQASQWARCRKLRPHELRKLQRGEALARY